MHFNNPVLDTVSNLIRTIIAGKQAQSRGILSRRDLQRIVAEMVG